MDDKRFDQLVRMVGQGASRRAILKGFLGLGGAAIAGGVATETADARIRTRPTIPPPPPPGCQLPEQKCGDDCCLATDCHDGVCIPCAAPGVVCDGVCCTSGVCTNLGECCDPGEKACGTVCCASTESCARDGNTDYCCTQASCGLDCCEDPIQCCDEECCYPNEACLARAYNKSGDGFEETCCPADLTCDGGCCDGECYVPDGPPLEFNGFPLSQDLIDRECCPAGNSVCQGAANATCCDDETEQCCVREGVAICIAADACCTDVDCDLGECDFCDITDPINSVCVDRTEYCNEEYGECSICVNGNCIDSEPLCGEEGCLTCVNGQCIDGDAECTDACSTCFNGACVFDCRDIVGEASCCDDPCFTCNELTGLCDAPVCDDNEVCCSGFCFAGTPQTVTCCTFEDPTCPDGCQSCSATADEPGGICTAACDASEPCCLFGESAQDWFCTPAGTCCPGAPNCNPEVEGSCPDGITCGEEESCCIINGTYTCISGDGCECNPSMTPGERPTDANACTVDEECCDGFCCRGFCLPADACCSADINPCNGCSTCLLGLCVPDCEDDVCCDSSTDPAEWFCVEFGITCCTNDDCGSDDPCLVCDTETGSCVSPCAGSEDGEFCCEGESEQGYVCFENDQCCLNSECGACGVCRNGSCASGGSGDCASPFCQSCSDEETAGIFECVANPGAAGNACEDQCTVCNASGQCVDDADDGVACSVYQGGFCCAGACTDPSTAHVCGEGANAVCCAEPNQCIDDACCLEDDVCGTPLNAVCCDDPEAPNCCPIDSDMCDSGGPCCVSGSQCCDDEDCGECGICTDGTCGADPNNTCTAVDQCEACRVNQDGTYSCQDVPNNPAVPCNDNNVCTQTDVCINGVCTGTNPVDCDEIDVCTVDVCDPVDGCPTESACGTGACCPANSDTCDPSTEPCCVTGTVCCNDDQCDDLETCEDGTCRCGEGPACSGSEVCCTPPGATTPLCVDTTQESECCADTDCDLNETCNSTGVCRCGTGPDCSLIDPNAVCCDPGVGLACIVPTPGQFCCDAEDCGSTGNPCTRYLCSGGGCVVQPVDGACTTDTITEDGICCFGTCTQLGTNTNCTGCGIACTPNDLCFTADCVEDAQSESGFACQQTPLVCDDSDLCTTDTCDPATGCVHTPVPNGTPCTSDNNICTLDVCINGVCTHNLGTKPSVEDAALTPGEEGNGCEVASCSSSSECVTCCCHITMRCPSGGSGGLGHCHGSPDNCMDEVEEAGFAAETWLTEIEECVPRDYCGANECGLVDDGCGGTFDCGVCRTTPGPCVVTTSCDGQCGPIADNCGGTLECPACPTAPPADSGLVGEGGECTDSAQCAAGVCAGPNCRTRHRGAKTCQAACA